MTKKSTNSYNVDIIPIDYYIRLIFLGSKNLLLSQETPIFFNKLKIFGGDFYFPVFDPVPTTQHLTNPDLLFLFISKIGGRGGGGFCAS